MFKRISVYFAIISMCFTAFADTELTYWFNGDRVQNKTSCESGNDITAPAAPYKYGYRFTGWEPAQTYDISTLDTSIAYNTANVVSGQLYATFSYGLIIFDWHCSSYTAAQANTGLNIVNTSGPQCFCKVIGIKPVNETLVYTPNSSNWVFIKYYNANVNTCNSSCAEWCRDFVQQSAANRAKMYGL